MIRKHSVCLSVILSTSLFCLHSFFLFSARASTVSICVLALLMLVPEPEASSFIPKVADFLFSFVGSRFFITMKYRNVDAPQGAKRDTGHPHKFTRTCKSPRPRAPLLAAHQSSAKQSPERTPRPRRQAPSPEQRWGGPWSPRGTATPSDRCHLGERNAYTCPQHTRGRAGCEAGAHTAPRKACTRVCPTLSPQCAPRGPSPPAREPHQTVGNFPGAQLRPRVSRPLRGALPAAGAARAERRSAPPTPGARCAARARAAGGDAASAAAGGRLGLLRGGRRGGGARGGGRKEGTGGGRGSAGTVARRAAAVARAASLEVEPPARAPTPARTLTPRRAGGDRRSLHFIPRALQREATQVGR